MSICPICSGRHYIRKKHTFIIDGEFKTCAVKKQCDFCKGKNDLDWVELISGVDKWHMRVGPIKDVDDSPYEKLKKDQDQKILDLQIEKMIKENIYT